MRDLSLAWDLLGQFGVERDDRFGPVLLGRELVLRAFEMLNLDHGERNASILINGAAATFLWGVIDPLASEYPIDGPEFGRLDALMWFGITTSIFVPNDVVFSSDDLPERPSFMRSTPDPMALELASYGFEKFGDLVKAARCAEELGEVVKADDGAARAHTHFTRATELFRRAGNSDREKISRSRSSATDSPRSPFFYREQGDLSSTTIAGSREYKALRNKLRLG